MPFSVICLLFAWLIQQNCPCQAQTSFGIGNNFTDESPFTGWSNTTNTLNTDNGFYYHGPFGKNGPTLSRSFVIDTSLISTTYSYILTLSYHLIFACNIESSDRVSTSIIVDGISESDETIRSNNARVTQSSDSPFTSLCDNSNSENKIWRSDIIKQNITLYGNDIINNGDNDIEISITGTLSDTVRQEFWMIGQIKLFIKSQSASPTKSPTFLPTSSPIFHTIDGNQDKVFCGSNWTNCTILCNS